jgi:hypothetical protein
VSEHFGVVISIATESKFQRYMDYGAPRDDYCMFIYAVNPRRLAELRFVPQGGLDAVPDGRVCTVQALGVDLEQDLKGVAGPLRHGGCRNVPVEPRRYGRMPQVIRCLGDQGRGYLLGEHAARARCHARMIVSLGNSVMLRSPANNRPSGAVPNSRRWSRSRIISSGQHGTIRLSPRERCLS